METHDWVKARNNKSISLVAHIPSSSPEETYPTIIYGHGFTGNKIGDNRMGIQLARFLCDKGYVVIRFDYIGSGESEGEFETDTSFSGWTEDFQTVLNWTKTLPYVDVSKIGIVGHSFSGAIVTYISTICPEVASVCALAPVFYLEESFKNTIIGNQLWEDALEGNTIKDFYNKKFSLGPFFVKDLAKYKMPEIALKVNIPMLVIHGKKDQVLSYKDSIDFNEKLHGIRKELKLFEKEGHLFTNDMHSDVLAWFRETLK
ncbi:prolyl oligopeptidase family serine peptidase [bacterium LRH843]|nr:prolyl oligopeptidase family serine peptidase [bacterium LRH843]